MVLMNFTGSSGIMSTVAIAANVWAESNVCKMEMKDRAIY